MKVRRFIPALNDRVFTPSTEIKKGRAWWARPPKALLGFFGLFFVRFVARFFIRGLFGFFSFVFQLFHGARVDRLFKQLEAALDGSTRPEVVFDVSVADLFMRVDLQGFNFLLGHDEFGGLGVVDAPDFSGDAELFGGTVAVADFQDDRHNQAADVAKFDEIKVAFGFKDLGPDSVLGEGFKELLVFLFVAR